MTHAAPVPAGSVWREAVMFTLALLLLLILGLVLPHLGGSPTINEQLFSLPAIGWLLIGLWTVIVLESALGLLQARGAKPAWLRFLLIALVPPSRLAVATHAPVRWIWLPGAGWRLRDHELFERLERDFAIPMLLITLLVIPVVLAELFLQSMIAASVEFALALHALTTLIWFAFATEFILTVSVAPNKLTYCKQHWVNIAIIILPLVAFLRTLAFFRILKLGKASQLLRTYRLRGLLVRAQRIALLLNLIERVMQRNPERYLRILRNREQDKLRELDKLRSKIRETEARLTERDSRSTEGTSTVTEHNDE